MFYSISYQLRSKLMNWGGGGGEADIYIFLFCATNLSLKIVVFIVCEHDYRLCYAIASYHCLQTKI